MQSPASRLILKRLLATTAIAGSLSVVFAQHAAYALPTGGQVNGGAADITSTTSQMIVNQSTGRALIDWNGFNIGSGEAVQFNQPNTSSIALNRVHSGAASSIDGSLTANGQVWLVNPQGVMFGGGAQVNVGGLLATTSDINNAEFMAGNYNFNTPGNPNGLISNAGHIKIADGGVAALVGTNVTNSGLIEARLGKVQLASGDSFSIDLFGDGLINLQASPAITSQLVQNSGVIAAAGGKVLLTTAAAQKTVNSLINMSGLIVANRVGEHNGVVTLYAEGSNAVQNNVAANKGQKSGTSNVLVSGIIDASAYASLDPTSGGVGGNISILGDNVAILSGSFIDASGDTGGGYIKIGGDFHGAGTTPTALNTYVDSNALIMANANTSGNGGNVAVWADNNTWLGPIWKSEPVSIVKTEPVGIVSRRSFVPSSRSLREF